MTIFGGCSSSNTKHESSRVLSLKVHQWPKLLPFFVTLLMGCLEKEAGLQVLLRIYFHHPSRNGSCCSCSRSGSRANEPRLALSTTIPAKKKKIKKNTTSLIKRAQMESMRGERTRSNRIRTSVYYPKLRKKGGRIYALQSGYRQCVGV